MKRGLPWSKSSTVFQNLMNSISSISPLPQPGGGKATIKIRSSSGAACRACAEARAYGDRGDRRDEIEPAILIEGVHEDRHLFWVQPHAHLHERHRKLDAVHGSTSIAVCHVDVSPEVVNLRKFSYELHQSCVT